MLARIEVAMRPDLSDTRGLKVARTIRQELGLEIEAARVVAVYTVEGLSDAQLDQVLEREALHDPVLHLASREPLAPRVMPEWDWLLEVGFRPGVTDNPGRTAAQTLATVLGLDSSAGERPVRVYTADQFVLRAPGLTREQVAKVGSDLLANELIQRFAVRGKDEGPGFEAHAAKVSGEAVTEVARIDLSAMSDEELMAFSRENTLALTLAEMHAMRDYYARPEVRAEREAAGIGTLPTDAEVEALAQTWSEHCKHKIFNARIAYEDVEAGDSRVVDSLFATYISGSTKRIRQAKGADDLCLSVFKDNAGVFRFDDETAACIKVETHNSPSALDPYGGALTGIVGVNRDPMGTGLGANLLCNTDVFCFASPFHEGELPPRLLHPRRVMEGVREGVEHGGNKSGIPTVNGSIVFDERYLGKPLVYCGTVGVMPAAIHGQPSWEKAALPGDAIVMTGGRIGKDGIHGATFSSEELHEGSPATAVQIGDPITQRKMYDFLMRARDAGLYNAITDNGAGGLSSSVGEMAEMSGGCDLDLSRAPLKYDGLRPWEILLSEAQERMTLAVPQAKLDDFLAMAREMDVEASVLGSFTDSGYFNVRHGEIPVARLAMDFLHEGLPQLELEARWQKPAIAASPAPQIEDHNELLKRMLGRLNICSKEYVVRQYDHEVQGGSVVKPMVGEQRDGPSDGGVLRPRLDSDRGLAVTHGICPRYSDYDTYWMMAAAIDEAVRSAVAVGADPDQLVGVDNFCWCDPVQSERTPDGRYKLAQLVRANMALAHFCQAYGVPCISGKDSMKNDYAHGSTKISIPPTVLYSVAGIVPDVNRAVTSDFKRPGELIYLLGMSYDETGGSEVAAELGFTGANLPQTDALAALSRYRTLHLAMASGLVRSCHDLSDGGLAVALAEMCLGGRLGAEVDLGRVPARPETMDLVALLYGESTGRLLVGVEPEHAQAFEALFAGQVFARIGQVAEGGDDCRLTLTQGVAQVVDLDVAELTHAFKATLDW